MLPIIGVKALNGISNYVKRNTLPNVVVTPKPYQRRKKGFTDGAIGLIESVKGLVTSKPTITLQHNVDAKQAGVGIAAIVVIAVLAIFGKRLFKR